MVSSKIREGKKTIAVSSSSCLISIIEEAERLQRNSLKDLLKEEARAFRNSEDDLRPTLDIDS